MNIPVIPTFSCSCWVAYSESPPVYLVMSLELLWTVWSHFKVRYSLVLACNCSKKSTVAPQMQSQLNCRILISCACHFLGTYPFFSLLRLASSACESLFSVWSLPWHEWLKVATFSGWLAQLCCEQGRTLQKCCCYVWGVFEEDGPHGGCHSPRWHAPPRSKLLRLPSHW